MKVLCNFSSLHRIIVCYFSSFVLHTTLSSVLSTAIFIILFFLMSWVSPVVKDLIKETDKKRNKLVRCIREGRRRKGFWWFPLARLTCWLGLYCLFGKSVELLYSPSVKRSMRCSLGLNNCSCKVFLFVCINV